MIDPFWDFCCLFSSISRRRFEQLLSGSATSALCAGWKEISARRLPEICRPLDAPRARCYITRSLCKCCSKNVKIVKKLNSRLELQSICVILLYFRNYTCIFQITLNPRVLQVKVCIEFNQYQQPGSRNDLQSILHTMIRM